MAVNYMPKGYNTVTPYLVAEHATEVISFATKAFGAKAGEPVNTPDGQLMHCDMSIGDSRIMLCQAGDKMPAQQAMLYIYVKDVDATFKAGIAAGGVSVQDPKDQFYGDRAGCVKDTSGNQWWIATHIEDVTPEELKLRVAANCAPTKKAAAAH